MLKRAVTDAGINPKLSDHWLLRHAHANRAIDRGAALSVTSHTTCQRTH
jgi:hypothetical protein